MNSVKSKDIRQVSIETGDLDKESRQSPDVSGLGDRSQSHTTPEIFLSKLKQTEHDEQGRGAHWVTDEVHLVAAGVFINVVGHGREVVFAELVPRKVPVFFGIFPVNTDDLYSIHKNTVW